MRCACTRQNAREAGSTNFSFWSYKSDRNEFNRDVTEIIQQLHFLIHDARYNLRYNLWGVIDYKNVRQEYYFRSLNVNVQIILTLSFHTLSITPRHILFHGLLMIAPAEKLLLVSPVSPFWISVDLREWLPRYFPRRKPADFYCTREQRKIWTTSWTLFFAELGRIRRIRGVGQIAEKRARRITLPMPPRVVRTTWEFLDDVREFAFIYRLRSPTGSAGSSLSLNNARADPLCRVSRPSSGSTTEWCTADPFESSLRKEARRGGTLALCNEV